MDLVCLFGNGILTKLLFILSLETFKSVLGIQGTSRVVGRFGDLTFHWDNTVQAVQIFMGWEGFFPVVSCLQL